MKKLIGISAVACLLALTSSSYGAQKNWSVALSQGLLSDGSAISSGSFTFQLGSFTSSFTPTVDNFADWSANFLTANLVNSTTTWVPFTDAPGFPTHGSADGETIVRPGEAPATGSQAYIWGYNTLDVSGPAEWILLTNSSWTFPAGTPEGGTALPTLPNWSTLDAGTVMVFGSAFNHTSGVDALNMVIQTQAIPEPSTYALIFGLGALGFLGYRRIRK